jgi:hypothetical protein
MSICETCIHWKRLEDTVDIGECFGGDPEDGRFVTWRSYTDCGKHETRDEYNRRRDAEVTPLLEEFVAYARKMNPGVPAVFMKFILGKSGQPGVGKSQWCKEAVEDPGPTLFSTPNYDINLERTKYVYVLVDNSDHDGKIIGVFEHEKDAESKRVEVIKENATGIVDEDYVYIYKEPLQ